jgi:hypothetical protein
MCHFCFITGEAGMLTLLFCSAVLKHETLYQLGTLTFKFFLRCWDCRYLIQYIINSNGNCFWKALF